MNDLVSSENKNGKVFLHMLARSFMYNKNNIGHKLDPRGTSHFATFIEDYTLL